MPNVHLLAETSYSPGLGALADGDAVGRACHDSGVLSDVEVVPSGSQTGAVPRSTLRRLARYPAQVVLDCPAGATTGVTQPVRAADAALVVSTPDRESQTDAVKSARMVRSLDTPLLGAVVTRAADQTAVAGGPLGDECEVLGTVPEIEGPILGNRVGRAAYARLAAACPSGIFNPVGPLK
jgi:septum site-determining protein MinD